MREEEAALQRRARPSGLEVGEASVTNRQGWRWAGLMREANGSAAGKQRREKGRRGERRVVGPTGAKSSFHMAFNGSRMKNPTECRIRNES